MGKSSCITAWALASTFASVYACNSSIDVVQAAGESGGAETTDQDDGANTASGSGSGSGSGKGAVSAERDDGSSKAAAGVSGNTETEKPKKKFTLIRIVIIVAISAGAAIIIGLILYVIIWRCCSSGARQRRKNTKGSANGKAPSISHPVKTARRDAFDPYGPPPTSESKSGHQGPYGYRGAPSAPNP
jgi:hypothetical protein